MEDVKGLRRFRRRPLGGRGGVTALRLFRQRPFLNDLLPFPGEGVEVGRGEGWTCVERRTVRCYCSTGCIDGAEAAKVTIWSFKTTIFGEGRG